MKSYEDIIRKLTIYKDLEISEEQIKQGKLKDANASLETLKEKYGL